MITKIDDINIDDKGKLVRKPMEPIDVATAIDQIRLSYQPVMGVALSPLECLMAGHRYETVNKDTGEKIVLNPKAKPAPHMKESDSAISQPNDDQKDALLDNIIKAVLQNESSFSTDTLYSYARLLPETPLSFQYVAERGLEKLEVLAENKAIREINDVDKIYAR